MIEKYFRKPMVLNRLTGASFSSTLESFSGYLSKNDYSIRSSTNYIRAINHFCYWIETKNISLNTINADIVDIFLYDHFKNCCCPIPKGSPIKACRFALKHFLNMLHELNILIIPQEPPALSLQDKIIYDFSTYLININGVMLSTIKTYSSHIKQFLNEQYNNGSMEFKQLTANRIRQYVANKANEYKPKTSKLLAASLRAFFRFLAITNQILYPLWHAVPSIACRRLSTVPKYLTREQLKYFLSSFNLSSPIGLRDKAMALLMARLGLRSHEVAQLTIEDISWREGTFRIMKSKSQHTVYFPLTNEIGKILALYLKKGRPPTEERHIFVTHALPKGRALPATAIQSAIKEAFKRCKLPVPSYGTHVLRHTLATQLLQRGASIKDIADILNHRSIDTTFIYAKVNLEQLSQVMLPWPEVKL